MEISTHGRNINMEDLAKASDYTRGLGSRTGGVHRDLLRQGHRRGLGRVSLGPGGVDGLPRR